MENILNILETIIKNIVQYPEDITFSVYEGLTEDNKEVVTVNIGMNVDDIGLCIGRNGTTIFALRTICLIYGYKFINKKLHININEPKYFTKN